MYVCEVWVLIDIIQGKENIKELLGKEMKEKGFSVKILSTSYGLCFVSFDIPTFSALFIFPTQLMINIKTQNRNLLHYLAICTCLILHKWLSSAGVSPPTWGCFCVLWCKRPQTEECSLQALISYRGGKKGLHSAEDNFLCLALTSLCLFLLFS